VSQGSDWIVGTLPDSQAHKGIAVLNPADLDGLGIENGGMVELRGARTSIATARSSRNVDSGTILLDATTRLNTSSRVGERISLDRADFRALTSVTLDLVSDGFSQDYNDLVGPAVFGPARIG